jgi:hypothetical protein
METRLRCSLIIFPSIYILSSIYFSEASFLPFQLLSNFGCSRDSSDRLLPKEYVEMELPRFRLQAPTNISPDSQDESLNLSQPYRPQQSAKWPVARNCGG